ncbi:MAG: LPS-assembly protein LptD, partial [Candidatus Omnitrophica bacterium]|nr:LPS-assembly protein LptD [Candidatus Omnitrophota bacterium]
MRGRTCRLLLAIVCLCAAAPAVSAETEQSPRVRRLLSEGKSALDHRDYARACGTFQEALSLEPESSWAKLYLQICEERRRAEHPAVIEPSQMQERRRAERAEESATGRSRRAQEQAERRVRDRQEQERERLERRLEAERKAQERSRPKPKKRQPAQPQRPSEPEQPPSVEAPPTAPSAPPAPAPEPSAEAPAPESSASLIPAIEEALPGEQPVVVHGDQIEFEPGTQKVIGVGHIRIDYHGLRLTADRVTVYLDSKDAFAEGHVVLTQADGVLTGELIYLNFETQKGTVIDVAVRTTPQDQSPPIYGKGRIAHKLSDQLLEIHKGYLTTCDFDPPHWRINSRRAEVHLGDKVVSQRNVLAVGRVPLLPLPNFS